MKNAPAAYAPEQHPIQEFSGVCHAALRQLAATQNLAVQTGTLAIVKTSAQAPIVAEPCLAHTRAEAAACLTETMFQALKTAAQAS